MHNEWIKAAKQLIGSGLMVGGGFPMPKNPRDFRTGSKYRPHQGAWECQRRVMQRRGEWPRKKNGQA